MLRQVNFIENPANRTTHDKAVMVPTLGHKYDSVFIEVSLETYITKPFKQWLEEAVFCRLTPGAAVRIAIISPESN